MISETQLKELTKEAVRLQNLLSAGLINIEEWKAFLKKVIDLETKYAIKNSTPAFDQSEELRRHSIKLKEKYFKQ